MAYNKFIKKDGTTLLDLTTDTITADKLAKGLVAHDRSGNEIVGTYEEVVLNYYDGSVIITGGETLISFTIDTDHYEAVEGMTWGEWIESSYNTDGYVVDEEDNILSTGEAVGQVIDRNNAGVKSGDLIIADASYGLVHGGGTND